MAYINKDQESDAPWLAAGFLTAGILLVSAPACLSPKWSATPLLKTGCSLISVGFEVTSLLLYRRIRFVLYPQWLRNRDYQCALQEDLAALTLKNELSKQAAVLVAQTRAELEEQFPSSSQRTLQPEEDTSRPQPPQTTNDCQKEVERLWNELTTDQQKKVFKNLEKSLEAPPDKAFEDSTSVTSASQESLAGSESGSEVPGGHLEAIHELIKAGMTLTKAIGLVGGVRSGRRFTKYSQAYKAKYGD